MPSKIKIKVLDSATGYDLVAREYDKKEDYLDSFEKGRVLDMLGDLSGKKVLDVGAGTGRLSLKLSKLGADVTALDVSAEMLKKIKDKSGSCRRPIKTVVGDAEILPFGENSFDIIVAAFLIVHLKDPVRFFDEAYRVLKDGGVLLVTNINQKDPPEIKTNAGTIKIESFYHRPEAVREKLESLAFSITREEFVRTSSDWINQIILAVK